MMIPDITSPIIVAAIVSGTGLLIGKSLDLYSHWREDQRDESEKRLDVTVQDRAQYRQEMSALVDRLSREIDRLSERVGELQGEVDSLREFINEHGLTAPLPSRRRQVRQA